MEQVSLSMLRVNTVLEQPPQKNESQPDLVCLHGSGSIIWPYVTCLGGWNTRLLFCKSHMFSTARYICVHLGSTFLERWVNFVTCKV